MIQFLYWFIGIILGIVAFFLFGYAIPWRIFEAVGHPITRLPKPLLVLLLPLSILLLPFVVASHNRHTHPVQARLIEWLFGLTYALAGLGFLIFLASD